MIGERYVSSSARLRTRLGSNVNPNDRSTRPEFTELIKLIYTESLILAQDERWRRA